MTRTAAPGATLYEKDFYAWTRAQARALRGVVATRPNAPVDWPRLIEEVLALGKSERDAVRNHLRTLIEHLLKLAAARSPVPRAGWRATVVRTRAALDDTLSASLARDARRQLPRLWAQGRAAAIASLEEHSEAIDPRSLPETCPWTLEQMLDPAWWPSRR